MNSTTFKAIVDSIKENQHGCKLWPGQRNDRGYGRLNFNGKKRQAHRVAFALYREEIPRGFFVCHKCDCPPCVNPDHLWLGTHQENMIDMARKGRARSVVAIGRQEPAVLRPLRIPETPEEKHIVKILHGKEVHFWWMGLGWMATFDNKNVLNPWTKTFFSRFLSCWRCAKFCAKKGFYPTMKPRAYRLRLGLPSITL
jgi:HNH endonuclease